MRRAYSSFLLEKPGEVILVLEAQFESYFFNAEFLCLKELFGFIEFYSYEILIWRHSRVCFESHSEVRKANPVCLAEFRKVEGIEYLLIHRMLGLLDQIAGMSGESYSLSVADYF